MHHEGEDRDECQETGGRGIFDEPLVRAGPTERDTQHGQLKHVDIEELPVGQIRPNLAKKKDYLFLSL